MALSGSVSATLLSMPLSPQNLESLANWSSSPCKSEADTVVYYSSLTGLSFCLVSPCTRKKMPMQLHGCEDGVLLLLKMALALAWNSLTVAARMGLVER